MAFILGDRHKNYEDAYDYKIIRRLPVIIRIDGKNFHRVTKRLQRPYSIQMVGLMANTMLSTAQQIEGCTFAYQQSDEITFVLRNDQTLETEAWYNNRIQKMASIASAFGTYFFCNLLNSMDEKPNLIGPTIFDARVFAVPSIHEVINNLIFRQQDCIRNAVTAAAQAELGKKFGRKSAAKMLHGRSTSERLELLYDKCYIDFHDFYPSGFRFGIAAYRVPKIVQTPSGQITRQRWALDDNLPDFVKRKDILLTILNSGRDIFRADRDLDQRSEDVEEESEEE